MSENPLIRLCSLPLPPDLILKLIESLETDPSHAPLIARLIERMTEEPIEAWNDFCARFPRSDMSARDILELQYER